jgi:lysyl-tRNA synthetase class 2
MKMGLERKLKERIPEIAEVVQILPDAPNITTDNIENVLDGVRPFLAVAGGKVLLESLVDVGGLQPTINLKMEGKAAALQSVKMEIIQRLQRHFVRPIRVVWV